MVTARTLGILFLPLLLLRASGMKTSRNVEQPRNVCLGLINEGKYESFHLGNTADCFTKCRQSGNEPCDPESLQRYWLKYEFYLVENQTKIVNMSFVKAVVQNVSTNISEDLLFSLTPSQNMTFSCVFWDATKGPTGDWSSTGCSTELSTKRTVCRCDHLTFFALLLRPILDQATVQDLVRISQAGCGASMIFLAFTVVLYAALRFYRQRFKSEDAPKVHVALSVSLFLLNLTFFINIGHGPEQSDATCWPRGAIFHYFLLCTFTWMGLEAFHLYLLVIKVFNTYFGHYFLKLSLVGWGLPALIVIGTGSANSYGHYAIRDKKNMVTLELCWFHEKTNVAAFYVTVHGYFIIISLFSAVVLGLVAWKIFTLPTATAGKEQGPNWKGVLTVLSLSSLVGVTWWLAILTPLGRSTIYVFALFNSLQGVFIFCWFAVLYFPSRTAVSSSSGTARADQVHTTSHE
ncbi:adhesion G protein-coupled receptor G3 isoform X4 [Hyaena hyaena]|uniref:adhesion G protein-coupled receptor G3 isoform X4 n=1 Tax=Hyaena hyaena TaxID=95912 RepID=UPI001921A882|nr:adhesion G protein-coupled receptor G3 isoform X4 [Hyaena hyaena]